MAVVIDVYDDGEWGMSSSIGIKRERGTQDRLNVYKMITIVRVAEQTYTQWVRTDLRTVGTNRLTHSGYEQTYAQWVRTDLHTVGTNRLTHSEYR